MPSDLGLGPAEVGAAGGAVDGKCPGAGGVQRAVGQRAIGRVFPIRHVHHRAIAAQPGTVSKLAIQQTGNVANAGGQTITYQVYKNGSAVTGIVPSRHM